MLLQGAPGVRLTSVREFRGEEAVAAEGHVNQARPFCCVRRWTPGKPIGDLLCYCQPVCAPEIRGPMLPQRVPESNAKQSRRLPCERLGAVGCSVIFPVQPFSDATTKNRRQNPAPVMQMLDHGGALCHFAFRSCIELCMVGCGGDLPRNFL